MKTDLEQFSRYTVKSLTNNLEETL